MKIEGTQMNKLTAKGWGGKYTIDIDHMKIYIELDCEDEKDCYKVYHHFFNEEYLKHDKEALENALYDRFKDYYRIETIYETKNYCFLNDCCYVSFELLLC